MNNSFANRDHIIAGVRQELLGPSLSGKEIDCDIDVNFENRQDSYGPWKQKTTGEEILQRERPANRYGAGILFPLVSAADNAVLDGEEGEGGEQRDEEEVLDNVDSVLEGPDEKFLGRRALAEDDDHDFDISGINAFRPNSIGITFLAEVAQGCDLKVQVEAGRYIRKTVYIEKEARVWWLRQKVSLTLRFPEKDLFPDGLRAIHPEIISSENTEGLCLSVEGYSRNYESVIGESSRRMITVCLVNRSVPGPYLDEYCLFQSWFKCEMVSPQGTPHILAYPSRAFEQRADDPEIESLTLLYREFETFGVGHGCAADWKTIQGADRVFSISAEAVPVCEVPSITPEIKRDDNAHSRVQVSMAALAGLVADNDGMSSLDEVITLYGSWIEKQRLRSDFPPYLSSVASRHLDACTKALERMREGLGSLKSDNRVMEAFRLANQAVLLQQLSTSGEKRYCTFNNKEKVFEFSEPFRGPDVSSVPDGRGNWRPFQIAFLLSCLHSTAEPSAVDREEVELLWFPTGGGKTEAYLGLTAFSIFLRRLKGPDDVGTNVLMRYTLRLLTSQQFQRASSLVCAMELIRRKSPESLGETPFSIGLWLGGATTPNTAAAAVTAFDSMYKGQLANISFSVLQCPWCRAQLGPHQEGAKNVPKVFGYKKIGDEIVIACQDQECPFYDRLPLYVVDAYIYAKKPDLIIGTVDKFAQLAWRHDVRNLFGIGADGAREYTPPSLIIQDELHLISGPLGSMVGIYEGLIEELCTDRRDGNVSRPKIISSTATIRRSEQQIHSLYGRSNPNLFPPPGIDASDSFFSSFAKYDSGELMPGKKFIGAYTPNLPSMQTAQVRTFASLLQSPMELPESDRDPWWTLMAFFNNLKELGNTLSLLQSDIPNHLASIYMRSADGVARRRAWNSIELTGRLRDQEVPEALERLNVSFGSSNPTPLDVCLASSIIEVGIDIERLSLMVVVGQPKTTSQYIQVTGRVGRRWWESPGLIVTLYGVSRPRDRSHFEKFKSYHERLYANVEPTSVTPFAPPVLERALHASLIGYIRQLGDTKDISTPRPFPQILGDQFREILMERVKEIDPNELSNVLTKFDKLVSDWQIIDGLEWGTPSGIPEENDFLTASGTYIPEELRSTVWPTPTSLRNVDAECEMEITRHYLSDALQDVSAEDT